MSDNQQVENDITKEHVLITVSDSVMGGTKYTAYLDKPIEESSKYRNLIDFMLRATEKDEFELIMNGPGGYLTTCIQLVHTIQQTKATVIGNLVGEICSAHANIFIACHGHIVHPYACIMVHTLTGGAWGKGDDIVRMGQASNDVAKLMYTEIYEGFLSDEELITVLDNNQDLWIVGANEINKRLEGLHDCRELAVNILQEAQEEEAIAALKEKARELGMVDSTVVAASNS